MSETQDKLNWLAFRYVANELDATEANDFESLLITDQAARETVARAVEETTRIRQALANAAVVVTAASQRSSWSRKTTRVAIVAVGSCLALLLALCLVRSSLPIAGGVAHQSIESDSSVSPARQLAYAWAEARNGLTELQPVTNPGLTDSLDVLIAAIDSESEQSLVAPSWMLAALAKMDGGIDSATEIQE